MFRIKKLDTFMIRQFMLLFVGTFVVSQFVLMMQFLWRYVDELIGKGISMEVMAKFFWYMGLMLVPQALPLALLLSSLITFGNLGESSELTAIKAAGISLMQTMRSLIVVAVIITFGSFYFQNYVGPDANVKMRQLLLSMKETLVLAESFSGALLYMAFGIPKVVARASKETVNALMSAEVPAGVEIEIKL